MGTRLLLATRVCGFLALGACSAGDAGGPIVPSDDPRQNVMVIDDGIDLSATDLRGKVLAAFTRECPSKPASDAGTDGANASEADGGSMGDGGSSSSFEDRKREYIAELMTPGQCHLRAGIDPKPAPLVNVSRFRDRWNAMLRQQRYVDAVFSEAEWTELDAAMDAEYRAFAFHGTTTSGTVAHDNPGVRLVLIDMSLGSAQESEDSFACFTQAEIDEGVALAVDPEVRDAYANAPVSAYTEEFRSIVAQYNVGLINESFGEQARIVIEQMQLARGCAPISLAAYFTAVGELDRARAEVVGPRPYLTVQSAGNESASIDSIADSFNCTPGDERHLLVGSTDLAQVPSGFSNVGACVDVFAPGEDIIAPYRGGWLLPVQGTSYSAPLVTRLISRTPFAPYDPAEAGRRLLDRRDTARVIPVATFPRGFFYVPQISGTRFGALTSSQRSVPLPGVRAGRHANLGRVDWNNPALWPLRRSSPR